MDVLTRTNTVITAASPAGLFLRQLVRGTTPGAFDDHPA
jgi:hypothetical protein